LIVLEIESIYFFYYRHNKSKYMSFTASFMFSIKQIKQSVRLKPDESAYMNDVWMPKSAYSIERFNSKKYYRYAIYFWEKIHKSPVTDTDDRYRVSWK
jgi:hypothetical protein